MKEAIDILKQFIDAGVRMGVCQNLETADALANAWKTIINELNSIKPQDGDKV
jgi:hypothetical protein